MVLLWTCLFAALGGFLFGYDLGLIGSALLQIRRYFDIRSSAMEGLIVGAAKLGATIGTFLGGAAMARYGRQRALALNSVAFTAGPLIMAAASAPWMLILGRFVVGLGIGASATVSPAYIAEVAPASTRGMLVQLYEVMLCIGMLSAPLVDWLLSKSNPDISWRAMVGLPALPGLLLAAAPLVLPESPRWLVTHNRLDEALQVLTMVMRGRWRLFGRQGGLLIGDYRCLTDKDDRAVCDAEDELLQLWSCIQMDRNAVLEQRRKLWRLRNMRRGRRWGGLGCWRGDEGRPKPPPLDSIPEESSSQLATPSCLSSASSLALTTAGSQGAPIGGTLRMEELWLGQAASPSGAASVIISRQPTLPSRGSPLGLSGAGSGGGNEDGDPESLGLLGGGRRGVPTGEGRGRLLSAVTRQEDSGGGSVIGTLYRSLESKDKSRAGSRQDAGTASRISSAETSLGSGNDEREQLLSSEVYSGELIASEPGCPRPPERVAPPISLSDMPGEEPSFLRTLAVLITDIGALALGPERWALGLAMGLAFFDQVTAATTIINYAPSLLRQQAHEGSDLDDGGAMLYSVLIGATKAVGVGAALLLVDRCGRRPLLITGSLACAAALGGLTVASLAGDVNLMEAAMCAFTLFFSLSWAGLYWVVVSELFSMTAKSAATSAATGLLFLTGAVTNMVFPSLHNLLGAYAFLLFAALCLASAIFVAALLPETKGRTLTEIQALLTPRDGAGATAEPGRASELTERRGRAAGTKFIQLWERRGSSQRGS